MSTKNLAIISIVVTYILIVFGGYVASSESGMGCGPDWPLCNGVLIPVLKGATLIEYTHRMIGAILAILAVILFIRILRGNTENATRTAAVSMIALLIIQILLGAVVVFLDTPAIIVTIHLIIAMTFLASLIFIWQSLKLEESIQPVKPQRNLPHNKMKFHINMLLVLLVFTLGLGAYIKHQSFGLACDWGGCRDSWLPASGPEILQTLHRLFAVASAVYILVLTYWSFAKKWGSSMQNRLLLATIAVLAQLAIGIFTIMTNLEISWAVFHLAVATALFGIISEARVQVGMSAGTGISNYLSSNGKVHKY